MADPSRQDNSWRTNSFRQKIVSSIDDAMTQSGNPITKTSIEMENHVFSRAQSKEEYLLLVAKLIHHIQEIKQKNAAAVAATNTAASIGSMQHAVDPINALQNLAKKGLTPQQAPGMMQSGIPQPSGLSQPGPGQGGLIQTVMGQGGMVQGNMAQGGMVQGGMAQGGMVQGGMVQGGMVQGNMTQGGMVQTGMVQTGMAQVGMAQGGIVQGGMQQRPPFQSYQPQTRLPNAQFVMVNKGLPATGPMPRGPLQTGLYPAQSMASPGNPGSCNPVAVPSPASASSTAMLSPAPGMVPSPSPQSAVNPSSVSWYAGSVPSPSSVALSTPGNPASVASPAMGARLTVASTTEEQAYLDKWKQLQKYIEPLKRMINKINKDEDRKKDLSKMKNLLGILSDSSKRLPMGTLLKCEQVLEKLELHNKTGTPASSSHSSMPAVSGVIEQKNKLGDTYMDAQHICQPLMDAIAAQVNAPLLNHSLYRTFGPALHMLQGAPLRVPSPPPAKRARVSENEVSDVLQGEIARLDDRFHVSLDPLQPLGSSTLQLICRLDDRRLPCIPPICVTVPAQYPDLSPSCEPTLDGYDATPFLQKVQKILASQILKMPDRFSVTALLDTWEMSVRKSYASSCTG